MQEINKNRGCCSKLHAKIFEIILIIGFLLSIILLIVNLIISLWCFKHSYPLFIIEIGLLSLNALSFILSIILRVWRSDGSVFNKNFSSSNGIAIFNLILIIINLLASITEEILFSFVISYLSGFIDKETQEIMDIYNVIENYGKYAEEFGGEFGEEFMEEFLSSIYDNANIEDLPKKLEKLKKKKKNFDKIMKKNSLNKLFNDEDEDEDEDEGNDDFENKIKLLKILPWIAISFNIFIQFLMFIISIILKQRISLKSDFGFPQIDNNNSAQNNIIGNNPNSEGISNNNNIHHHGHKRIKKRTKKLKEVDTDNFKSEQIKIVKNKHKKKSHKNKKH